MPLYLLAASLILAAAAPPPATAPARAAPPAAVQAPSPPQQARITVSTDRKSLLVEGPLTKGVADGFRKIANAARGVETVVLESPGGLLVEAGAMAEFIRAKKLDTYVVNQCSSACTIVLLAGRDRAASPNARIGFHHPIFPDAQPGELPGLRHWARGFYDEAGLKPAFTDKIFATPYEDMWHPDFAELVAAKVLTRQTLGGETSAIMSSLPSKADFRAVLLNNGYWPALERRFPEVARNAVDAAWAIRERGGSDEEAGTALRAVMIAAAPRYMATASPALLDELVKLGREQALAARGISFEACDKLSRGEVNPGLIFPPEMVGREARLLTQALTDPAHKVAIDRAAAGDAMAEIMSGWPEDQVRAIARPGERPSPRSRCEATIALYEGIQRLEPGRRDAVSRAMFGMVQ